MFSFKKHLYLKREHCIILIVETQVKTIGEGKNKGERMVMMNDLHKRNGFDIAIHMVENKW